MRMGSSLFPAVVVLAAMWFFAACGAIHETSTEPGATGGIVFIVGGTMSADAVVDAQVVAVGTPSEYWVRPYKAEIAKIGENGITCPEDDASWYVIFEDSDRSDCIVDITPDNIASYYDIKTNPDFGSADVPAGRYDCLRTTVCDHLLIVPPDAMSECPNDYYVVEIAEDDAGGITEYAEPVVNYWTTYGSSYGYGNADSPFEFEGFAVREGETLTLKMEFNITNALNYDPRADPKCYVDPPEISFSESQ